MPSITINDLLGVKYTSHGRTKEEGFDCYGIAIEVLKRAGINMPDVFYNETNQKKEIIAKIKKLVSYEKIENPVKWCIIMFILHEQPMHIGVYLGNGQFIHATRNVGVVVEPIHRYRSKIEGYYKVSN